MQEKIENHNNNQRQEEEIAERRYQIAAIDSWIEEMERMVINIRSVIKKEEAVNEVIRPYEQAIERLKGYRKFLHSVTPPEKI